MPGWKALPEELDPDVRAFTERLRRLIDRSGLGVTAVAERTGHERSAWDTYLNARRSVPRSAVVALAEVTGSDPATLATDWERAERAWTRTAAPLGGGSVELRPEPEPEPETETEGGDGDGGHGHGPGGDDRTMQIRRLDRPGPAAPHPASAGATSGGPTSAGVTPAGPASGGSAVGASGPGAPAPGTAPSGASAPGNPAPAPAAPGRPAPGVAVPPAPVATPPPGASPPRTPNSRRRKVLLAVTGVVGALLVVTAAVLLVDLGGSEGPGEGDKAAAPPTTTAPPTTRPADLPPGVQCAGPDCTGRDPEAMGCGGPLATTVARAVVGAAQVEVRYSETCGAAWARLTGGAPRDTVTIRAGDAERRATVAAGTDTAATETDAYTPMVAVASAAEAQACGRLADGGEGCTAGP
ncbi:XRE family transcriptional regulator [Streptomyces sp. MBT42]|uniref:helix-turn-helix domain-containing protein n=1 Tax=Streptomyces sp. MBT42 TaxID=1488373 RepID=UPI001E2C2408|nr:XRE family transcriptional regulator [Streptomyces sp. MBT42]MCD2464910.1 XRE family transcriptional regulator [Streptomyces sp. MBT42]